MKGDFSRQTFDPRKHYKGVRMQQGRVQLDADWNENVDILTYRIETETIDVIGTAGVPEHDAGFGVYPNVPGIPAGQQPDTGKYSLQGGSDFWLTRGRAYLDGILCEIDETLPFSQQPHVLPKAAPEFDATGPYVAYLDVWQRHVTALDDPAIREIALGGPDTATRVQTIWQVKLSKAGKQGEHVTCESPLENWPPRRSTGRLRARTQPGDPADDPCSVPIGGGYRRLENQLYRVEVHKASGEAGGPSFKWSRDNGSVVVAVEAFNVGGNAAKIKVAGLGRDDELGLHRLNYVEISDDATDLAGKPGTVAQITEIDPEDLVLTLSVPVSGFSTGMHAKVRRWDSPGAVPITVPVANDGYLELEDGVQVRFELTTENGDAAVFRTGDYWLIPARTVPGKFGDIEWPKEAANSPAALLPQGIIHHYMKLAIVTVSAGPDGNLVITDVQDCRKKFPPLTELPVGQAGCCSVTVGPDGDYPDLQSAVDARPAEAKYWHVCMMPGEHHIEKTVLIKNTDGLAVSGCYGQSLLVAQEGQPVLQVLNSKNILLDSLMIRSATDSYGVLFVRVNDVRVSNCTGVNGDFFDTNLSYYRKDMAAGLAALGPMLVLLGCEGVEIRDNLFVGRPAVVAMARHLEILHNNLSGGGVQILPGSANASIEDNRIMRGYGPGVQIGGDSEIWEALLQQAKEEALVAREMGIEVDTVSGPREASYADKVAEERGYTRLKDSRTLEIMRATQLVQINNNLIAKMSGSGVVTALKFQADVEMGDVEMLSITRNRIISCAFEPDLELSDRLKIGGGIVLTGVASAQIAHNLVFNNGAGSNATCGIFVLDGSDIEINSNVVQENGIENTEPEPVGYQAGIAALAVMGNHLGFQDLAGKGAGDVRTGLPALRVHDNEVVAPSGQALAVFAVGTVSVQGNTFASRAPRKQASALGGWSTLLSIGTCVTVLNFGQPIWMSGLAVAEAIDLTFDALAKAAERPANRLPDGKVMFHDNQVALTYETLPPGEEEGDALPCSVFVYTGDDASLQANQIHSDPYPASILTNVMAGGLTVRASGNTFTEPLGYGLISYLSGGPAMNTTMGNQGVHCIITNGGKKAESGNLVINELRCEELRKIFGG